MASQASAASSSSAPSCSASTSYTGYDAFINHRGRDVRNTFVAHLYSRLRDLGLKVFLDKPEMWERHPIPPQIQAAIEVASVHIAVFSPRYAESNWCLDVLVLMVKSKRPIIPVFYKVKPSELQGTIDNGAYAIALRKQEQKKTVDSDSDEEKPRYNPEIIRTWRSALSYAAELSGIELDGDEEELSKFVHDEEAVLKVVHGVLKNVPNAPLYVARYPTGLEVKLFEFETAVLNNHEERMTAQVVGIVGYGGVGKTTLAKLFFNRKKSHYKASSFLLDVRETSVRKSLSHLQSKLLEDLKHQNIKIESPDEGIEVLKRYLSSCHALIVIDDVDNVSQLDMLLPVKDVLSAESLIVVTTRDKQVLKSWHLPETSIHNLKGLNILNSKVLFSVHAFNQLLPPLEFADLLDRFVAACDGNPLLLKVTGALVCGQEKQKQYWEEQLERVQQTLPDKIHKILRISYDSLSEQDKAIFLDIACFFLGENKDKAIRIWGLGGIRTLETKCLLDNGNKIRMHDDIRDYARSIAKEQSMPCRLWQQRPNMIVDSLNKLSSVETEVRGITSIVLSISGVPVSFSDVVNQTEDGQFLQVKPYYDRELTEISQPSSPFNDFDFRSMKNLQLLGTEDAFLEGILRSVQSPDLMWLRWYRCSCGSLPDWIPMKNLRVLEVAGSNLKSLWSDQCEVPVQLRELHIMAPLSEFPKSIGLLKQLECIIIGSSCEVTALPGEFCYLSSLKCLVLIGFSRLMSLPDSFGNLTNLQQINLEGACSLKMLPESFGNLNRLKYLYLTGAEAMLSLPDSLGKLINLQHISLEGVCSLKMLPDSFVDLSGLEYLSLTGAKTMLSLPDSFGKLKNLQHISLVGACSLKMLPDSFVDITPLKYLSLKGAEAMLRLPDSFGKLTNLQHINLEGACNLKMFADSVFERVSEFDDYLENRKSWRLL